MLTSVSFFLNHNLQDSSQVPNPNQWSSEFFTAPLEWQTVFVNKLQHGTIYNVGPTDDASVVDGADQETPFNLVGGCLLGPGFNSEMAVKAIEFWVRTKT